MTTPVLDTVLDAAPAAPATRRPRPMPPIPFTRLMTLELRKMFDTRAGFWLMMSVAITAALATGAVILWAPDDAITLDSFGAAVGAPLAVVLPVIAILSVTSEYTQRTGLATYTLVPRRGRVIGAKLAVTVAIGVVSMALAFGVGSLGNLLGAAIVGIDPVWDISVVSFLEIVLASVVGMLMGFMLGTVMRSSAAAVVGYFVYSLVLPGIFGTLAAYQEWFRDLQPWVDVNYALGYLYEGGLTGQEWAHVGVTTLVWLFVPLAAGLRLVLRSEVK